MKIFVISDIHGGANFLEKAIECFENEKADKLVILGDLFSEYTREDNDRIVEMINKNIKKVSLIEGNCDRNFEDYFIQIKTPSYIVDNIDANGLVITVTHGHIYNYSYTPEICGDIFIQGHTHVPVLDKMYGKIFANPGSITRPRGAELRCYLLIDENSIYLKTLEQNIIKKIDFDLN